LKYNHVVGAFVQKGVDSWIFQPISKTKLEEFKKEFNSVRIQKDLKPEEIKLINLGYKGFLEIR